MKYVEELYVQLIIYTYDSINLVRMCCSYVWAGTNTVVCKQDTCYMIHDHGPSTYADWKNGCFWFPQVEPFLNVVDLFWKMSIFCTWSKFFKYIQITFKYNPNISFGLWIPTVVDNTKNIPQIYFKCILLDICGKYILQMSQNPPNIFHIIHKIFPKYVHILQTNSCFQSTIISKYILRWSKPSDVYQSTQNIFQMFSGGSFPANIFHTWPTIPQRPAQQIKVCRLAGFLHHTMIVPHSKKAAPFICTYQKKEQWYCFCQNRKTEKARIRHELCCAYFGAQSQPVCKLWTVEIVRADSISSFCLLPGSAHVCKHKVCQEKQANIPKNRNKQKKELMQAGYSWNVSEIKFVEF